MDRFPDGGITSPLPEQRSGPIWGTPPLSEIVCAHISRLVFGGPDALMLTWDEQGSVKHVGGGFELSQQMPGVSTEVMEMERPEGHPDPADEPAFFSIPHPEQAGSSGLDGEPTPLRDNETATRNASDLFMA